MDANPGMSPQQAWAIMTMGAITFMALGAVAYKSVTDWCAAWHERRRIWRLKNAPSVMRKRIVELEAMVAELSADREALRTQNEALRHKNSDQEEELKRLNGRNAFMARELRGDPNAQTIALERPSFPGRWRWQKVPEE